MAELADALDLGSSGVIRGGSSPLSPTILIPAKAGIFFVVITSRCDALVTSAKPIQLDPVLNKISSLMNNSARAFIKGKSCESRVTAKESSGSTLCFSEA